MEIEEEGRAAVVRREQPLALLDDAVDVRPDACLRQLRPVARREDVTLEALLEAEGLIEPAVRLDGIAAVARVAQRLRERGDALAEAVAHVADRVRARPQRGQQRRHRDLRPRRLRLRALEEHAARGPARELGRRVGRESVGRRAVRAQGVDDDQHEVRSALRREARADLAARHRPRAGDENERRRKEADTSQPTRSEASRPARSEASRPARSEAEPSEDRTGWPSEGRQPERER